MPMLKMVVAAGILVFGAVALFLGLVVTMGAVSGGEIEYSYSYGDQASKVTTRVVQSEQPDEFWRAVGWLGAFPMVLGVLGIWFGRRQMRQE